MKRFFLFLVLAVALVGASSCKKINGKGDVVSEKRDISGYSGISLSCEGDVYYTPDSVYSLEILAQQNIIDVIETYTDGGTLIIKVRDHYVIGKHDPVTINISAPHVSYFNVSGSGAFHLRNVIEEPAIEFGISGSGNISASTIYANDLNATISGSGNVSAIAGTANFEHLNISGSGDIDFVNIVADTVYATISGSGDIKVNVIKLLDGTISGSGSIGYLGNPVVNSHISGSGSIYHL